MKASRTAHGHTLLDWATTSSQQMRATFSGATGLAGGSCGMAMFIPTRIFPSFPARYLDHLDRFVSAQTPARHPRTIVNLNPCRNCWSTTCTNPLTKS